LQSAIGWSGLCATLVETSVHISGTLYSSVAYVVTENDTLYAINGTPGTGTCSIISTLPLLPILTTVTGHTNTAVACSGVGGQDCATIAPVVGILGTPVINISGSVGTIYLVTYSQDTLGNYYHYLHAINIQTMAEETGSPVRIAPPGSSSAQASNFSQEHIQRPGLLFANGNSYVDVAFSMMDGYQPPYPNGAVFGYNTASLSATPLYFQTSVGLQSASNGGGIWQGGAAPAYGQDSGGNNFIYLKTANGTFDGSSNWGDSLLKLNPTTLTVPSGQYFTPADQFYRSSATCTNGYQGASPQVGDMDYGSGGVMLIPDGSLASWPYLALSGDKEGGIWFNDRTTPATSPHVSTCDPSTCSCSAADGVVQAYWTNLPNYGQVIHNSPAYWQGGGNSYLYLGPQNWATKSLQGYLQRYPLCSASGSTYPIDAVCGGVEQAVDPTFTAVSFPYGVTPSISAASNSATDAIVWAIWGDGSTLTQSGSPKVAVLYAFDASDVNAKGKLTQLYASSGGGNTCAADAMTVAATKFSVPTVANSYVYVGAQGPVGVNSGNVGMFYIFGPNRSCQ
jgi:hypothetical protein